MSIRSPSAPKAIGLADRRQGRMTWGPILIAILILFGLASVGQANTSHAGWPAIDNLVMDKDTSGGSQVLRGAPGVHNELLGGYGSDTIYGADGGDVIWTNYHPDYNLYDPQHTYCPHISAYIGMLTVKPKTRRELAAVRVVYHASDRACRALPSDTGLPAAPAPTNEVGTVHAGNGDNFIYATDTRNYIWTGTGATVVHASVGGGVIHCESTRVIVFMSHRSRPHYDLIGCRHISYFSVGY